MRTTSHQACFFAHDLTRLGTIGEIDRLSTTLFDSKVDLNPHQVEAALFAIANPLQRGVVLADEVGLGKTIEAGLVLCQRWAERRRRLVVVCPAHIRKQWQTELVEKFNLPSIVLDRKVYNRLEREPVANPFDCGKIVIISYGFAARMKDELRAVPFDLVVFDEAHKLRNAYQPSRRGGQAVRWAFELRQKILLTATPLQNSLLELYGLGWLIDDHIFGEKSSFQTRYCSAGGDLAGLRERLSQVCKRTLRKDCPYIRYTKRQAMSHPFSQTTEEKRLHQDVLEFIRREISYAFPTRQRQLIEMILFKTLASSPQALASTLRTMRARLVAIRDGLHHSPEDHLISELTEDGDLDLDAIIDPMDEAEEPSPSDAQPAKGALLAQELAQLDALIERADSIASDSKSRALIKALDAAFARLEEIGAGRKALIFTESRKTQAFLASYLEANGYANRVVTFNGSNTHPSAHRAYQRFVAKHEGSDTLTGSKAIDVRTALIEEFRDHADILLATEAAAEGVNLQFCSLVVNYDLPWNPQRIEQRIGRCHRYGQKHDVVVVNFIAQDNLADRRVQDLLQQKFSLFDGLFGASDEVLGAIEDGIDFEKRVHSILKSCRTDAEIENAFSTLQKELESTINQRMLEARRQLFEHFDADVHDRLKVRHDDANLALDRVAQRFWRLSHWGLEGRAQFDDTRFEITLPSPPAPGIEPGRYRLISAAKADDTDIGPEAHLLRLSSPLGQWLLDSAKSAEHPTVSIRFDVSGHSRKVSALAPLVGKAGWLRLDKLVIDADAREEHLLFTAVTDTGENLDQDQAQRLMDLDALTVDGSASGPDVATASRLAGDAERLSAASLTRAAERSNARFSQVQKQINQWAEDKVRAAELELDAIKRELHAARRQSELTETLQARQQAVELVAQLERKQRRQRKAIFDVEDEVEAQRVQYIAELKRRIAHSHEAQTLFVIRWEAE